MAGQSKTEPFHERFAIEVGIQDGQQRFINRVSIHVFQDMTDGTLRDLLFSQGIGLHDVAGFVAFKLGEPLGNSPNPMAFVQGDFLRCLRVLEAYIVFDSLGVGDALSERIDNAMNTSEVDLEVRWQPPTFVRTGAPVLDKQLVNDSLGLLREGEYTTVLEPFEKGLAHYSEAANKPERLGDVVTDMYEAVEALAKIVTGKPNNHLATNAELFISKVNASKHYKTLLRNYISYGNEFRHAEEEGKPRPSLSEPEVESFIYLTDLFIRLAIRTT
jgi:hypothetical protein